MTTEADLLRAICANPRDDVVRLVYADWLEDHDRLTQAAFIRDGLRPVGLRPADPCRELVPDMTLAISGSWLEQDDWLLRCPVGCEKAVVRRGFIEGLKLPCDGWIDRGPALVQQYPLLEVSLSDKEPFRHADGWCWIDDLDTQAESISTWRYSSLTERARLPRKLFCQCGLIIFSSAKAAYECLRRRCLAWARNKAGLPPLTEAS